MGQRDPVLTDPADSADIKTEFIDGAWQATIWGDCNVYTGKTKTKAIRKAKNRPVIPEMCNVCGDFLYLESELCQAQDPPEMCPECYQEAFADFVLNKKKLGS